MDRLACVDIPALPLQLLLRRHPDWRSHPVAVIDEDRPQGALLWVNERARRMRVLPGQRYATSLALSSELRAGVVPPAEVGAGVAALTRELRRFSPHVEPSADRPGTFWLDASGLARLYPTLEAWAEAIDGHLRQSGLRSAVIVGFSRFGTYAISRASRRTIVLGTRKDELRAAGDVPLERLDLPPRVRDRLMRLGIETVADLHTLPAASLMRRFGPEVYQLYRLARGEGFDPFAPAPEAIPASGRLDLDDPVRNAYRLLFMVKQLLDPIVRTLAGRRTAVLRLRLRLVLDRAEDEDHVIRPAAPTLDTTLLLDLVRLRLESLALRSGVVELHLHADEVPAEADQLRLFPVRARRDRAAAERALARIRAEQGDEAVGRFRLEEGHLPEARSAFEPIEHLPEPRPTPPAERMLVRRVFSRPAPLAPLPRQMRNDGWAPRDPEQGPVGLMFGPYVVSGGWWRGEVHREYRFAETRRGDVLWVYYDRRRRRWFQQGEVE